ncbi:MAG: enoyl-CoA hydratase/isomerase family protein [Desulfobacterium sp.]|nr:enoyl-CoA hydratase/isomerase family protein [Desulfobacterium sp.]
MTETDLIYSRDEAIAHITINREAHRNAISGQAVRLFLDYLDRAENNPAVRVVCITGAGNRVFCSGADLGGDMATAGAADMFQSYARLLTRLYQFPKPTVARINGHCLAGGTGFMLACDMVIAREDVLFGTPEVNVGLFPMMIGALIFRNVLRKKAMEMILMGEKLTAKQALDMGMITRMVPKESFDNEVDKVLSALAAKSPIGLALGKKAFNAVEGMELGEAVNHLSDQLAKVATTKDATEGITAFLEKRKPVFTGE